MKSRRTRAQVVPKVEPLILAVRGTRVILDADLAAVYGVTTKRLNEQVKRNRKRFPEDFCFQLSTEEWKSMPALRSQNATAWRGGIRSQNATASKRNIRFMPYAFTEHGAIMAANVLNSKRAVQMSVFVVRAFIRMRSMFTDNKELARKLSELERELKNRLDVHDTAIVGILQRIMSLIDPPALPEPKKRPIGFGAGEE